MGMNLRVVVPPHPLISHWLTVLRSSSTPAALYATALEELGRWLTYEAVREWLPNKKEIDLSTHLGTECKIVDTTIPLLTVPILPAGLPLWQGAQKVLPNSQLCLEGVPNNIEQNAGIIIFIDQIATGVRLLKAIKKLQEQNIESNRIRIITSLSSSRGLQEISKSITDLVIHTACIDQELNQTGEIIPGIGNPNLRLNTRTKAYP